jgi:hypothetical protein
MAVLTIDHSSLSARLCLILSVRRSERALVFTHFTGLRHTAHPHATMVFFQDEAGDALAQRPRGKPDAAPSKQKDKQVKALGKTRTQQASSVRARPALLLALPHPLAPHVRPSFAPVSLGRFDASGTYAR